MLSLLLTLFTFVELNCENFFDWYPDSIKNDVEFTPEGEMHWDKSRFYDKLFNIGREIYSCSNDTNVPDLIALCEVENDTVLTYLTKRSMLRTLRYEFVVTHSPDARGINVAFVYNPLTFKPVSTYPIRVTPIKGMSPTRDILYLKGATQTDTLHCFAVHAPSRRGGESHSLPFRMAVAQRLCQSVDSIYRTNPGASIIVAGDFNDYQHDKALKLLESHDLENISARAKGQVATGTYFFQGEWNSLDHIFLSPALARKTESCHINDAPFLLERNAEGRLVPHRNYRGTYYNHGFSDHLPLVLNLKP